MFRRFRCAKKLHSVATRRYDLPPKIIPQKIEVRRFRRLRRLKEISHKFGSPQTAVKILRRSIIAYHFDAIAAIAMHVQHPKHGLDHAWSVWDNADTITISSCYSTASILQWRLRSVIEASFVASWESSATANRGQRRDSRRYQCPLLHYPLLRFPAPRIQRCYSGVPEIRYVARDNCQIVKQCGCCDETIRL